MAIAKVIYKENSQATPEVWMDTTQKTVTSGSMLNGTTALKNDGTGITGNIASKSSSDLTISDKTVVVPAGYYSSEASKTVPVNLRSATVDPSTSSQTVTPGYDETEIADISNQSVSSSSPHKITVDLSSFVNGDICHFSGKICEYDDYARATTTIDEVFTWSSSNSFHLNGPNWDVTITSSQIVVSNTTSSYVYDSRYARFLSPTKINKVSTPYDGLSSVTVTAMPSMILPTSTDASATSGYTSKATISRSTSDQYINIPTGYNAAGAYYKVNAVPNGSVTAPSTISGTSATVSTGTNTLTLTKSVSVTPSVTTAGYVSSGTAGNSSVSLTASVNTRSSSDLTVSGDTVTAPAGYYGSAASKAVASGTAGTPTATKGTVSNHSVSITPSVTNTTGYITGSTKTGTGVTVTVSELESGTKTITENGTGISVSGYSNVDVAVPSGYYTATITERPSSGVLDGVRYEGITYTNVGQFQFLGGKELTVTFHRSGGSGNGFVYTNGELRGTVETYGSSGYVTITLPFDNIEIAFQYSNSVASTNISSLSDFPITYDASKGFIYRTLQNPLIPPDVTIIGKGAFYSYENLSLVSLPSGVTSIGSYAFYGCTRLALTSLPSGLTNIGSDSFYDCTSLALTSLPSGVTSIGNHAFRNCSSLALTSLPSGVTSIGSYAFYNCSSLALTSLPSGVTSIGSYAFYGCSNLALTSLSSGLTGIGDYAFYGCSNLALTSLSSVLTSIGGHAFRYCSGLTSMSLPSSLTSIGTYAFASCTGLTLVSCSGAITTLGSYAFSGASSLKTASFSNMALTSNMGTVFGSATASEACQELETVDIGVTTGIGANAFANCYKLSTLILRKTSVCTLSNVSAFLNTPIRGYNSLTGTVYVPSSLIASYQTATNWKTIYDAGTVTFSAIEGSAYEL